MKKGIPKIQYITQDTPLFSHAEQAKLAFEMGIESVQIRMKNSSKKEILKEASLALGYANQFNGILIINDSVEIAKKIGAHAVHLGLNDMPVNEARKRLGEDFIIGGTANSFEDILLQKSRRADYVGLGPFRYTKTKKNLSTIIGIEGYQKIISQLKKYNINIPIVAVGGIQLDEIEMLKQEGLYGVAVSGALLKKLNTPKINRHAGIKNWR